MQRHSIQQALDALITDEYHRSTICQWLKVIFVLWLLLPPRRFDGAVLLHKLLLRPFVSSHEATIDRRLASVSNKARTTARRAMAVRWSSFVRWQQGLFSNMHHLIQSNTKTTNTYQEVGGVLARTFGPAAALHNQRQPSEGQQGGVSAALELIEMARASLLPLLAATRAKEKDDMDVD